MTSQSRERKPKIAWKFWLGLSWMVFNLSLAAWWLIYGLRQIRFVQSFSTELESTHSGLVADFVRQQRMLISEGSILMASLLIGGGSLLYYITQEKQRSQKIKEFFATFSHELKTSLASLRLQVESLADDFKDERASNPLFERLVKDSVRLEIQLENSLSLAQFESSGLFIEKLNLRRLLSSLEHQWPEVKFVLEGEVGIQGDRRALESVLKNLIQNSIVHGGARTIRFEQSASQGRAIVRVKDDGSGFSGDPKKLGELFLRHNAKSGSGVGLYLVVGLVRKMGGEVEFLKSHSGFQVELRLPLDAGSST